MQHTNSDLPEMEYAERITANEGVNMHTTTVSIPTPP